MDEDLEASWVDARSVASQLEMHSVHSAQGEVRSLGVAGTRDDLPAVDMISICVLNQDIAERTDERREQLHWLRAWGDEIKAKFAILGRLALMSAISTVCLHLGKDLV